MIKIENTEVIGWEHAIRGMRNPKNSWDRMDSAPCYASGTCSGCYYDEDEGGCSYGSENNVGEAYLVGPNDHKLMMSLSAGGPVHAKYRRMITVYMDVTAPLYWWKEFDTYKVGTVANSCSTMHKIHAKEFALDDFSHEHLINGEINFDYTDPECFEIEMQNWYPIHLLEATVDVLNHFRKLFLETKDKKYWWQMIQLLPTSYNQKRTIMLNYEVLHNIYISRKDHKLDEWREFSSWIECLPYSEIITSKKSGV